MHTLEPAYVHPSRTDLWDQIVWSRPTAIIANVASGPGSGANPDWGRVLSRCQAAGIAVLGYVATGYGTRSRDVVLEEASKWIQFYPGLINGIFWDEASSWAMLGGQKGLHGFARKFGRPSAPSPSAGLSIFNPGSDDAPKVAMTVMPGSIWCSYENNATAYMTLKPRPLWFPSRQCHLVYACWDDIRLQVEAQMASSVGWGFVTSDDLPNPWDRQ